MFVSICPLQVTSEAYSSSSIVLASNQHDGSRIIFDDFREAYYWLRQNTPEDAKVMSWWNYGYQITAMANRTILVDNNTWNNTHISSVGQVCGQGCQLCIGYLWWADWICFRCERQLLSSLTLGVYAASTVLAMLTMHHCVYTEYLHHYWKHQNIERMAIAGNTCISRLYKFVSEINVCTSANKFTYSCCIGCCDTKGITFCQGQLYYADSEVCGGEGSIPIYTWVTNSDWFEPSFSILLQDVNRVGFYYITSVGALHYKRAREMAILWYGIVYIDTYIRLTDFTS